MTPSCRRPACCWSARASRSWAWPPASPQALGQARALRPDLILVDIGLGDESGFDLARLLARDDLAAEVILISTGAEADYAELIDDSPAAGFLPKSDLSLHGISRLLGHTP